MSFLNISGRTTFATSYKFQKSKQKNGEVHTRSLAKYKIKT